jgi:hypothetical protein
VFVGVTGGFAGFSRHFSIVRGRRIARVLLARAIFMVPKGIIMSPIY